MTVFLVTLTNLVDGRSLVVGVYANDAIAQAAAKLVRASCAADEAQVFVTETDVIGSTP